MALLNSKALTRTLVIRSYKLAYIQKVGDLKETSVSLKKKYSFRRDVFKCYANQKFHGNGTFQDFVWLRINV